MEKIYKIETLQIGSKYVIKVSNTLGLYSIEFELNNNKNLIKKLEKTNLNFLGLQNFLVEEKNIQGVMRLL